MLFFLIINRPVGRNKSLLLSRERKQTVSDKVVPLRLVKMLSETKLLSDLVLMLELFSVAVSCFSVF